MSSNIKITRICQFCGHEFIAKTTVTKHCSDNCAKKAYKARIKNQKIEESDAETKIIRESPQIHVKTFEYLTVNDVATLLKCDRRTVHDMIKLGRLNAINLSTRKTRVLKKDLDGMFLPPPPLKKTTNNHLYQIKINDQHLKTAIQWGRF